MERMGFSIFSLLYRHSQPFTFLVNVPVFQWTFLFLLFNVFVICSGFVSHFIYGPLGIKEVTVTFYTAKMDWSVGNSMATVEKQEEAVCISVSADIMGFTSEIIG
jgi:hypothetical protein